MSLRAFVIFRFNFVYRAARSVTFCTRQLASSPTSSSFSLRQSIELTRPNSFGSLPALPNLPTTLPFEIDLVDRRVLHAVGIAGVRHVQELAAARA